jgi:PAS domain-containing protein
LNQGDLDYERRIQKQLLEELAGMRQRISSLERSNKKHKKDKDALKQSKKRFRLIFENAPEGIYQTTPEGRFISMNPAFA